MGRGYCRRLVQALLITALMACGGDDGGGGEDSGPVVTPAPAPTPTPTPTATPTPFAAVPASLFPAPLYNTALAVRGHGWLAGLTPPVTSAPLKNVTAADSFSVSYDPATGTYRASAPLVGEGILVQIGELDFENRFTAVISADKAGAVPPGEVRVGPGGGAGDYRYVATAVPYHSTEPGVDPARLLFGYFGVAQPTRPEDVPTAGIVRYAGAMNGWFSEDAGGTGAGADVIFDLDFSGGATSATIKVEFWCIMGCAYPDIQFTVENIHKTGPNTFAGVINHPGAPTPGAFQAIVAGPGAAEVLAGIKFPYPHPEFNFWTTYGGIVTAKKQ
jgi:hypothetical protein